MKLALPSGVKTAPLPVGVGTASLLSGEKIAALLSSVVIAVPPSNVKTTALSSDAEASSAAVTLSTPETLTVSRATEALYSLNPKILYLVS